jgi:hypothetical protein
MQASTRIRLIKGARRLSDTFHKHARGCKVSPPADCARCKRQILWYQELPLWLLSLVLMEEEA